MNSARRVPLWLRGIARRPHTAVLVCLLSGAAVMTAMLGPGLDRSVHQATLADALDTGGVLSASPTTGVSISGDVPAGQPYDLIRGPATTALEAATTGAASELWSAPEVVITSTTVIVWKSRSSAVGQNALVTAFSDDCTTYILSAGVCPSGAGEVMISTDDATQQKVRLGGTITYTLARAPRTSGTVVGIYDAAASVRAELVRPGSDAGVTAGVDTDPVVMRTQESAELPLPVTVTVRTTIRPDLRIDQVALVQASIEETKLAVNAQDRLLALQSGLPDLLDRVESQARSAQVLLLVTTVQGLFLGVFALAIVLQRVGRARAAEWSVGRLRGVPRGRWLRSVYAEPVVALLAGVPLGYVAAAAVARFAVRLVLRPGTSVEIWRWPVVVAAAAATVVALAALVAVSLRSVRRPLAELVQQEVESRRLTVLGAVAHTAVFGLAAATVFQLVTGGVLVGLQLGLIAPGLFALAVALAAVRLAVVSVRRVTARAPRGLTGLVVGRYLARSPSALNPAMIIAVGVALTVFATQVFTWSERNQDLRADAVVGAATVLTVSVADGTDLLTAVRAADPSGRLAMAARDTATSGYSGAARIVAVDSSRLAAVSSWSPEWAGVADLADQLRGPTTEAITLTGKTITLDLTGVSVSPQSLPDPSANGAIDPPPPPVLVLTVTSGGRWQSVNLGRLAVGTKAHPQTFTAEVPCTDGCRLVSIGLSAPTNQPYRAALTVASVATDTQPASASADWLRTDGRWRVQSASVIVPDPIALATPRATPQGLAIEAYDLAGGMTSAVSPTDTTDPLPALLAPGTTLSDVPGSPGVGYGTGLDGQQQKLAVIGQAAILPRSLDDGVLVDLGNAQGLVDPSRIRTADQVWLAPHAGTATEQALADQGVQIVSRQTLQTTRDELTSQATTSGAAIAAVVSGVALLVTLLALVAARWSDADRRGSDWRTMREGGISRRRIRRLVLVEIGAPAVLGVLAGLLSGAVAAWIAAPRLPLVDFTVPGPPLDLTLSWPPILVIGGATIVAIALISAVGAVVESRRDPR